MQRFIDTNILIMLMTNDVPELAGQALDEVAASGTGELVVCDAVLVELLFVLEKHSLYRLPRATIASLFADIVATPQFLVNTQTLVAFENFTKHPKLDYVDCLLMAMSGHAAKRLVTFDQDLLKAATKKDAKNTLSTHALGQPLDNLTRNDYYPDVT